MVKATSTIIAVIILLLASYVNAASKSKIMQEVLENGKAYLLRQMAYASSLRYKGDGSWKEIGFEPANCSRTEELELRTDEHCHSNYFNYFGTEGIDAPRSGVGMKLRNSLAGCPAGEHWEIFVLWGKASAHEPDNNECKKLLPNFNKVLDEYKQVQKPVEIASPLQPVFAAMFYDFRWYYSDSTVPNLWVETAFSVQHQSANEWFSFEEIPTYLEFSTQRIYTGIRATLKKNLGKCSAEVSWEGYMVSDGRGLCQLVKVPKVSDCSQLTPRIENLTTCDTATLNNDLSEIRTKLYTNHQDSVNRRINFYKDSVRQKKIADSLAIEDCIAKGLKADSCRWSHTFISGGSSSPWTIDDYNYTTPLNFRKNCAISWKTAKKSLLGNN